MSNNKVTKLVSQIIRINSSKVFIQCVDKLISEGNMKQGDVVTLKSDNIEVRILTIEIYKNISRCSVTYDIIHSLDNPIKVTLSKFLELINEVE